VIPRVTALLLIACSGDRRDPPPPPPAPVVVAPADAAADAAATESYAFDRAIAHVEKRVAQRSPKMKLTDEQARAAVSALAAVGNRESFRALHAVMPRSTVELARAVADRGVPLDEADAIARYLVAVVKALDFERLDTFDENHSHVTGREWHEIDYSGEGMTWQQQKADWSPQGVENFKTARSIHAYFTGAERLPHWKRVYKPRGRMASVAAPQN
jgi:hypothetical protein